MSDWHFRDPSVFPRILSSGKEFYWTLGGSLDWDYFGLAQEGVASILLLGVHLAESHPWKCARNPIVLQGDPGVIDQESKRVLAKRFHMSTDGSDRGVGGHNVPLKGIDLMAAFDQCIERVGHSFEYPVVWPEWEKSPGKLVPRKISAELKVEIGLETWVLYARNFSEISQCLHAEIAILLKISEKISTMAQHPMAIQDFTLNCTLKPCKMCASWLYFVSKKCLQFSLSYELDDPGPLAKNTLLDQFGYRFCRRS